MRQARSIVRVLGFVLGFVVGGAFAIALSGCNAVEGIARDLSGMSHGVARTLESNGQN